MVRRYDLSTSSATSSVGYGAFFARYMKPHRARVIILGALLLVSIGLQLISPQILRRFIDMAQAGEPLRMLTVLSLVFLGTGLAQQGVSIATTYLGNELAWRATNTLRVDLADHCLKLGMPFHKLHTPGQMIERVDGDVLALANFFSQFTIQILGSLLLLVGILGALFLEDWRLGLGLLAFVAVSLAALAKIRSYAIAESTAERETSAQLFGFIEERLSSLDDIRANGAGAYVMRRFYETLRTFATTGIHAWTRRSALWLLSMGLFTVGQLLALALGAALFYSGSVTVGTVYLLVHYTMMLFQPIEQLSQQLQDLQKAGASIGRARELMGIRPEPDEGTVSNVPGEALAVTFQDVSFVYEDGEERVLQGLTFDLKPGTNLGLLGRTGSGKTTLSRLLFRLYAPSDGTILLGGVPLQDIRLGALRQRIGMVTQDVQLFGATVRDNLTLFDPSIADEKLVAILEELGLGEWYAALPKGLDTELTGGGGGLSAGEGQLLALARVFLKDPGLVILDEPSASLDPATERLIERAMFRLLQGRTAIIIAHRLSTVQRVDEIMILEDGHIVEHGSRSLLAADPGSRFHHLLQTGGMEDSFA